MKTIPEKYQETANSGIYSPAVCFSGEMVITAGQCCDDVEGFSGEMPEDIRTQARMAIQSCKEKLEAAGSGLEKVVYAEINMTDLSEWAAFNEVYKEMMPSPKPARKAIQVGLLPGYKVEIVMMAVK